MGKNIALYVFLIMIGVLIIVFVLFCCFFRRNKMFKRKYVTDEAKVNANRRLKVQGGIEDDEYPGRRF